MIDRQKADTYRRDPMEFFGDLVFPGADGRPLREVWAPYQRECFETLSPCILAVERGKKPPKRGAMLEWSKGGGKDTVIAAGVTHIQLFADRPVPMEAGADDLDQILETRKAQRELLVENNLTHLIDVQRHRSVALDSQGKPTGSELSFLTADATGAPWDCRAFSRRTSIWMWP